MATHIRCYGCRTLFDIKLPACPDCETPRRGQNKFLHTAKVNGQLNSQLESAHKEARFERAASAGLVT